MALIKRKTKKKLCILIEIGVRNFMWKIRSTQRGLVNRFTWCFLNDFYWNTFFLKHFIETDNCNAKDKLFLRTSLTTYNILYRHKFHYQRIIYLKWLELDLFLWLSNLHKIYLGLLVFWCFCFYFIQSRHMDWSQTLKVHSILYNEYQHYYRKYDAMEFFYISVY